MRNTFFAKYLLTALLSLCQATLIFAQDGHVKGKITNGHENLLEATVSVGNKTMTTNIDGEFFLTIKAGRYLLIISHAGYKKIEDSISIEPGTIQKLNYALSAAEQMGEVVVLGSRSMTQRSNLASPVPLDVITSAQ